MTVVAEDYAPGTGRVAVLGLGTIGAGMARSLLRAGLPVDAWNRTPERAAASPRLVPQRTPTRPTRPRTPR
jgi:3-hydroxyisobutyrate dehydrogenase